MVLTGCRMLICIYGCKRFFTNVWNITSDFFRSELGVTSFGFMLFDAYYTMNKKEWTDKTNKAYRDAVERRFATYYAKHKKRWKQLSEQEKMMISNGVRSRSVNEGMPMESITIDSWLKHIAKLKG